MSLIINRTTVKKMYYGATKIKKGYCNGVNVFNSEHTVTYVANGQSWTAVIDDGENCITSAANTNASAKIGSDCTLVGWTTSRGSTSPMATIAANDDNMTVYAIWSHAHIGTSTTRGGCYQGVSSHYDPVSNTGGSGVTFDGCGCQHQTHYWKCNECGATWSSTTHNSGNCTQGHSLSDDGSGDCPNGHRGGTSYALSCGKSAGTFCG